MSLMVSLKKKKFCLLTFDLGIFELNASYSGFARIQQAFTLMLFSFKHLSDTVPVIAVREEISTPSAGLLSCQKAEEKRQFITTSSLIKRVKAMKLQYKISSNHHITEAVLSKVRGFKNCCVESFIVLSLLLNRTVDLFHLNTVSVKMILFFWLNNQVHTTCSGPLPV